MQSCLAHCRHRNCESAAGPRCGRWRRVGPRKTPVLTELVLLSCQSQIRIRMLSYYGVDQDELLSEAEAALCKQLDTKDQALMLMYIGQLASSSPLKHVDFWCCLLAHCATHLQLPRSGGRLLGHLSLVRKTANRLVAP